MKRTVHLVVGLLIGLALLWFLFRGTSWAELRTSLRAAQPLWIAAAMVPLVASFFARILRWKYIVRAVQPDVSFRALFSATQIGFLANFVLPARIGELIRAVVLGRLARMPASRGLAVVALDRVTDLVGLLATIAVAVISFRPRTVEIPAALLGTSEDIVVRAEYLHTAEIGVGVFFLLVVGSLIALYTNRDLLLRISDGLVGLISERLAHRIHNMLDHFAHGLHVLRSPADMTKSIAFTLVTWACFILSSAAFCQAFRLDWPWYAPFVLQLGIAVFISIPGPPGFIGQFQLAVVASLLMAVPGIDLADALALAIVLHVANFAWVAILGVFALYWEGLSLVDLTREGEHVR